VALRRGIMLSFVSSLLQALTAIVLMGIVFALLRGTAISMTDATWFLEVASYVLVTLFGAWLLWTKLKPHLAAMSGRRPAYSLSAAEAHHDHHHHDHDHHHHDHHHDHGAGEVCATCGHVHAVDPATISGDRFDLRTAWSAVAAVGLRPCSGALIVLTFSFLNGLWMAGIVSVLAMALGTAITVSALAALAVTAKNVAVRFAGDGRMGNRIHFAIEIAGAALVFLLGLTLLAASLAA
jgi:ABC-type nickel/cobalt efflux system permease component RcnA